MNEEHTDYNPLEEDSIKEQNKTEDDLNLDTPATVNAKDSKKQDTNKVYSLANTGKIYTPITLVIKDSGEGIIYWELPLCPGLEEVIESKIGQEFGITTLSENIFCGQIEDALLYSLLQGDNTFSTKIEDVLKTKAQATTIKYGAQTHFQIPRKETNKDYHRHNSSNGTIAFGVGIVIAILCGKSLSSIMEEPLSKTETLDRLILINNPKTLSQ